MVAMAENSSSSHQPGVVSISYNDLLKFQEDASVRKELVEKVGQAFGDDETCLGIITVKAVPNFDLLRQRLLPLAQQVALLPDKDEIVDETTGYQVGWSHGKEKVEGDKLDLAKGSFYANPLLDNFLKEVPETDPVLAEANPAFFAPNVWPTKSLPDLEMAFKEMGQLICQVGRLVARLCDAYVKSKCPEYLEGKLERVLTESMFCKARLLHYFATEPKEVGTEDGSFSSWCGWHNDHGSLTGLVPAVYLDEDGKIVDCPDKSAGLYIKSRRGDIVQAKFDTLAFQVGETSQIHTGGLLQATPHAVRGCSDPSITRESFAVFMEPEYAGDMSLPPGKTVQDVQRHTSHLPKTVRKLQSRWKPGMNFGEFSDATFAAFYD